VFIDTCALLVAFKGKEPMSSEAFKYLDDPDNQFVINQYLRLEALPKPKFHQQKDEVEFINAFLNMDENIEVMSSQHLSEAALEIACKYDLSAVDALHVASAIEGGASKFVTNEKSTKPMFKVEGLDFISTLVRNG